MSKKRLISLVTFFLLWVCASSPVSAQSTYDQTFGEYKLSLEDYFRLHDDYILARSQYLRFDTLTSRNNAKEATRKMLAARDQVLIDYFRSIDARMHEIDGIDQSAKDRLSSQLLDEINWFTDHKNRLSGAGSIEDLVGDSEEAKQRYIKLGPVIYEPLSQIPYGRVRRFQERLNENLLAVKGKVNEIRAEERREYQFSTQKLEVIDRWIFETEDRLNRSNEKLNKIAENIDILTKAKSLSSSKSINDQIVESLKVVLQDQKDASLRMREIVREVKTK